MSAMFNGFHGINDEFVDRNITTCNLFSSVDREASKISFRKKCDQVVKKKKKFTVNK